MALASAASIVMAGTLSLQLADTGPDQTPTTPAASATTGVRVKPDTSTDTPATGGEFDLRALVAQCLNDQGFSPEYSTSDITVVDGEFTVEVTTDTNDEQRLALACAQGLNVSPRFLPGERGTAPSRTEAGELYDTYLLIRTCFTHSRLPLGDLPERDRFVSALAEGDGLIWHPYQDLLAEERLKDAMSACPMSEVEEWE